MKGTVESPFVSASEHDREGEPANVVDGLYSVARAIFAVAGAIEGLRLRLKFVDDENGH